MYEEAADMVSRKTYLMRMIGGGMCVFLINTVILALFFSLGRGHFVNFEDWIPWIAASAVGLILAVLWAIKNSKMLRERLHLCGPDHP
ncbi:hypothetical protein ACEE90_04990 [Corynebacterium phoceense]